MQPSPLARTTLLSILLVLGSTIGSHALTFSLAGDWSSSADVATDEWSYGKLTTAGNPGTFVIPTGTNYNTSDIAGMGFWFLEPGIGDPNIEKNLTASNIPSGTIVWRAGTVSFGPFNGPAVAQFTAPTAGVYNITATFQTDQIRGTETGDGTTGYVYVGGVQEYSQVLADPGHAQFGTAATFAPTDFTLTAGEKVDFVVGGGAFTTQVDATLTELPEPSVYAMMGIAGLGLGWGARRKNAFFQA